MDKPVKTAALDEIQMFGLKWGEKIGFGFKSSIQGSDGIFGRDDGRKTKIFFFFKGKLRWITFLIFLSRFTHLKKGKEKWSLTCLARVSGEVAPGAGRSARLLPAWLAGKLTAVSS